MPNQLHLKERLGRGFALIPFFLKGNTMQKNPTFYEKSVFMYKPRIGFVGIRTLSQREIQENRLTELLREAEYKKLLKNTV